MSRVDLPGHNLPTASPDTTFPETPRDPEAWEVGQQPPFQPRRQGRSQKSESRGRSGPLEAGEVTGGGRNRKEEAAAAQVGREGEEDEEEGGSNTEDGDEEDAAESDGEGSDEDEGEDNDQDDDEDDG